jgi:anti-sigma factor RsiW
MADPEEPACQEFVELVTDYLDGALDRRTRRRFEAHLAACDGCEAYLEQIRATVATAGSLRAAPLAPETRAALLALFDGWAAAR